MTSKSKSAPTYDPEARYALRVSRVVTHKRTVLRPKGAYTVKGQVLNELPADAIASAVPSSD